VWTLENRKAYKTQQILANFLESRGTLTLAKGKTIHGNTSRFRFLSFI